MSKVFKTVRALPSDPSVNDVLKVEYIEVNLNNSRKLIGSINSASTMSTDAVQETEGVVENMLRLRNIRNELAWLDDINKEQMEYSIRK